MKTLAHTLIIILLLSACNGKTKEHEPVFKPLLEGVYASGFVMAKDEYQVFAQVDGTIATKLVEDGDTITKGTPLYIIDAGQQSARFRIAKESYDQAIRNNHSDSPILKELQALVETSKSKMLFDSLNYTRYTNLWKQNATTKAEFDRFKLQYENAQREFTLQQSRYNKTRDQLRLELTNTLNQLQIASDESGRYIVKSDMNGRVFQTLKEKGELIRRAEMVAVIGQGNLFYLELQVDELDIQRIKPGQKVLAKIDAYPGKIFEAVVTKVYPKVNKQQQALRVDATLNESLPGNYSGLALEANIIVRERQHAMVIPKLAVLPGDSIQIKMGDDIKTVKLDKGIETLDEVEVLNPLDTATAKFIY